MHLKAEPGKALKDITLFSPNVLAHWGCWLTDGESLTSSS
jgi:hypothetical protein